MKHFVPQDGMSFLARIKSPEEVNLLSLSSKLIEEDLGRDVSNSEFMTLLMRHYLDLRKTTEIHRLADAMGLNLSNSRPRM